jgi:hypothetical protein
MPLQKLQFKPGVNRENTTYSNEGGWYSCDKVRFRSGYPEKIGGWVPATPGYTYDGVCRALINWIDLDSNDLLGVGTHKKYYIVYGGTYRNITPLRTTSNPIDNDPIATTNGSSIIIVTATANGAQVGDYVTLSGVVGPTIGGIDVDAINAEHEIINVLTSNTFEIDLGPGNVATSTTTGGGATVDADFQISVGLPVFTIGTGFGAGVWNGTNRTAQALLVYTSGIGTSPNALLDNVSTTINVDSTTGFTGSGFIQINSEVISYSGVTGTTFTGCVRGATISGSSTPATFHCVAPITGSATPAPISVRQVVGVLGTTGWGLASDVNFGVGQQLRLWSHDTFGQDLLINPRGSKIYYWANDTSTFPNALELTTDVPIEATNQVLVSDVSRFVICMGCNEFGGTDFDPMLIRWSDQENPNVWTPTATTQAGEQRLSAGSNTVVAKKSRQEILIWTDAALYSMQYLGPPYVWGFQLLMDNISIMSPNAVTIANNISFWMGTDKFYAYSGRVENLPCTVRQYIFNDLSFDQSYQVISGTNEGFSEVWWYYVSKEEVAKATEESRDPTVDKYVIYNHLEGTWVYGTLNRTAWLDSPLQNKPFAAVGTTTTGTLVFHETGTDDVTTDSPKPIEAFIESSDFDIGDGHNFGFIWRILPDLSFVNSTGNLTPECNMSVLSRINSGANYRGLTALSPQGINSTAVVIPVINTDNFPSSGYLLIDNEKIQYTGKTLTSFTGCVRGAFNTTAEPHAVNNSVSYYTTQSDVYRTATYPIEQYTGQIYTRVRGRQIAFKISSTKLGTAWQLGSPRIDIRPDGRR